MTKQFKTIGDFVINTETNTLYAFDVEKQEVSMLIHGSSKWCVVYSGEETQEQWNGLLSSARSSQGRKS